MAAKLAVVSGASSGIGAATSAALAGAGWRVVLVARGREALDAAAQRAASAGGQAVPLVADASDAAQVTALAERVTAEHGAPDLVVNSAGLGRWLYVHETGPEEAEQMFDAPFRAAWNLTRAFLPGMLRRGTGHLVHVGSPAAYLTWPGATAYAASRWALRGLNAALHADLAGSGVHSSHVVFGKVSSGYFTNNPGTEQWIPKVAAIIPTLTPEQCAAILMDVVRRPRREVFEPFMLRAFLWADWLLPGLVRLLVQQGRRPLPPP